MALILWVLFGIALIAASLWGALWLADRPGTVSIDWQGYGYDFEFGVVVTALIAFAAVVVFTYVLINWIWRLPRLVREATARSRRTRGYKALTTGMVAVAAGDGETAKAAARKADSLLDEPPLTMLLAAQAAQLNGDEGAATRYFEAMLENAETRFLGLRGLLTQALKRGDDVDAIDHIARAKDLRPETPWLARTAYETEARLRRWDDAQISLARAVRLGSVNAEDGRRHRAAVLLERSRAAEAAGDGANSRRLAHKAAAVNPGFAPALRREAVLFAREGKLAKARSLIEAAWRTWPHRLLAETYDALGPPEESPAARLARLERLAKIRPDDPESLMAIGAAALAAEDYDKTRAALIKVSQTDPCRRVYRLLARLEIAEKDDGEAAARWLNKAEAAKPDPAWICANCGTPAGNWAALCNACHGVDTLEWRTGEARTPLGGATLTLPRATAALSEAVSKT